MDDDSKKLDKNLMAINDAKLVTIQRNTMEAEVEAALAMKSDAETKTLIEKLPEEFHGELKNLIFVARAIGELSCNAGNARAVQTLIMNGLMKNTHPADILSSLVEYFAYQDKRILKALETEKAGSDIKPMKLTAFQEFMSNFVPNHKATLESKVIAKEIRNSTPGTGVLDVEEILNKTVSASHDNKSADYTNPDVQVEELMKRVVPGSRILN